MARDCAVREESMDTREVWAGRIQEWRQSGLSTRAFCAERGFSPNSLSWWRWAIKNGRSPAARRRPRRPVARVENSPSTAPGVSFVEVKGVPRTMDTARPTSSANTSPIEIVLPRGRSVRILPGFDAPTLRQILSLLEEDLAC